MAHTSFITRDQCGVRSPPDSRRKRRVERRQRSGGQGGEKGIALLPEESHVRMNAGRRGRGQQKRERRSPRRWGRSARPMPISNAAKPNDGAKGEAARADARLRNG